MSRIFDALQGTRSEISDLLPALVGDDPQAPVRPARPAPEPAAHAAQAPQTAPVSAMAPVVVNLAAMPASAPAATDSVRQIALAIPASAPLLPFENPNEPAAEQYRIARTKLAHHPKKPKVIVISSASAGDGKSVTAINLAGALSLKSESKVLLLDADFRRSTTHLQLGLPQTPGLAEVIMGQCGFEQAVIQAEQFPNLHVLVSGDSKGTNPSELLDSSRWQTLCKMIRSRYQYVIVDSPPVAAVADFDLIQLAADGTILVVRPDHTKRATCFKALETIPKEKFLGVLLNCEQDWFLSRATGYGYGYGYTYESSAKRNGNAGSGK
jgi:capsular exopolysaccharide synthesis family protein